MCEVARGTSQDQDKAKTTQLGISKARAYMVLHPYRCLETRKKSSSYCTYSDLPPNLAQQTANNTSYNS